MMGNDGTSWDIHQEMPNMVWYSKGVTRVRIFFKKKSHNHDVLGGTDGWMYCSVTGPINRRSQYSKK